MLWRSRTSLFLKRRYDRCTQEIMAACRTGWKSSCVLRVPDGQNYKDMQIMQLLQIYVWYEIRQQGLARQKLNWNEVVRIAIWFSRCVRTGTVTGTHFPILYNLLHLDNDLLQRCSALCKTDTNKDVPTGGRALLFCWVSILSFSP